jgi:hypothetical protein
MLWVSNWLANPAKVAKEPMRTLAVQSTRWRFVMAESRPRISSVLEMAGQVRGITGDPIEVADGRRFVELQQVDVFAHGQAADARALFQDQLLGTNPREADAAGVRNLVAEAAAQDRAPDGPRQEEDEEGEQAFHHRSLRNLIFTLSSIT